MKNAVRNSFEFEDEDISANPSVTEVTKTASPRISESMDLTVYEDEFDDDDWLDAELSDEELAALGEEDFEAAFADDFDDEPAQQGADSGDLDAMDDLDEFDLLEGPEERSPRNTAQAPDFVLQEDRQEDDGLFDTTQESVASEYDDEPQEFAQHEADDVADNYANFESDDEFSIDEDFSDDDSLEVTGAAIVTVDPTDVKVQKEGPSGVVSPGKIKSAIDNDDDEDDASSLDMDFSDFEDDGTYHRPVPRISIHAFCETSRNTAILERAAVDRRLMKAHFTMHSGGIEKAVDLYQSSSTPNLIILETVAGGSDLINQLGQLAEVCDPSSKVVIIGKVNDIQLYRELIRQGISEYIVRPKSPLQIIKTISDLYVDPSAPPIGKTVAFVGARGGVGSSTLAHNMGWAFAENFQSDTVILDLDLPFGTTALDFDHEPTSGLMEALTSPERLDDVLLERLLQKHTDHLSLFTAPNMLDRDYDIDDDAYETIIDVVRGTAPTVVIDVPHQWTGWSKKILQTADEIVITATPDFASFRNMKYLMEVIGSARPNDSKPHFIYNQFDPKTSAVPVEYFVENIELEPSLILGWEPQLFNSAATNAAPIMEMSPKSKVAQGLNELSGKILGRNEILALPSRFSLTSLFKRN